MTTKLQPAGVKATAAAAGVALADDAAARIAHALNPAFDGFASVAGNLAMDLEPANFVRAQTARSAS